MDIDLNTPGSQSIAVNPAFPDAKRKASAEAKTSLKFLAIALWLIALWITGSSLVRSCLVEEA